MDVLEVFFIMLSGQTLGTLMPTFSMTNNVSYLPHSICNNNIYYLVLVTNKQRHWSKRAARAGCTSPYPRLDFVSLDNLTLDLITSGDDVPLHALHRAVIMAAVGRAEGFRRLSREEINRLRKSVS